MAFPMALPHELRPYACTGSGTCGQKPSGRAGRASRSVAAMAAMAQQRGGDFFLLFPGESY